MRFNIYNNGEKINTIISDEKFCKKYCDANQYTYDVDEDNYEYELESTAFTQEDEIYAVLLDQEYRLTLLELGVSE